MKNETEIRVRGYHLDVYGHVNNARYLEFLEEARWALFEEELEYWQTVGLSFFVVNINISYRAPATLNEMLQIKSGISEVKSRSCVLKQSVFDKKSGRLVAEADVTFVVVDSSGKAIHIKDETLDQLKRLMG